MLTRNPAIVGKKIPRFFSREILSKNDTSSTILRGIIWSRWGQYKNAASKQHNSRAILHEANLQLDTYKSHLHVYQLATQEQCALAAQARIS